MILFPILLAAIWGIFNVPNDPSRSGKAPIPVSGIIRLLLEIGIFIVATWSLHAMEFNRLYIVYAVLIVIHYALSYDRIKWLLEQ